MDSAKVRNTKKMFRAAEVYVALVDNHFAFYINGDDDNFGAGDDKKENGK